MSVRQLDGRVRVWDDMKVLSVEQTPNPNARKFVVDHPAWPTPISLRIPATTTSTDPVAEQLMSIPGVVGILMLNDFVTISKSSEAKWADISAKTKRVLAKAGT